MTSRPKLEVFFDGDCPLCLREINMLRSMDRRDQIRFTDIAAAGFYAADYGLKQSDFMAQIRGRTADGEWLVGVEVFRQLYGAVGFGPIVSLTRLPGIRQGLDLAYSWFARHRLRLTGRCDDSGSCAVTSPELSRRDSSSAAP